MLCTDVDINIFSGLRMLEDKVLIWKFKRGSSDALCKIYQKYKRYLLTLVASLVNDFNTAEDVVHDFFVSFAQSSEKLKLQGSLKSYLAVCVVNKARDRIRNNSRRPENLEQAELLCTNEISPEFSAICNEEFQLLYSALKQIPYEQKEAIMLHIKGGIKFDDIAKMQNVSIKTVQSRYRYGLDKLKIILNGKVQK